MIEPEAELNVQKDIEYINNELISITHDGTYIKFSRPLNKAISLLRPKRVKKVENENLEEIQEKARAIFDF